MREYRTETVVREDGTVALNDVPFRAGDRIEVTVHPLSKQRPTIKEVQEHLAGSVLRFDDPTEPVGVEDWEALK